MEECSPPCARYSNFSVLICRSWGAPTDQQPSFSFWFDDPADVEPASPGGQQLERCPQPIGTQGRGYDAILEGLANLPVKDIFRSDQPSKPAPAIPVHVPVTSAGIASSQGGFGRPRDDALLLKPTASSDSKQGHSSSSMPLSGQNAPMTGPPTPQHHPALQPVSVAPGHGSSSTLLSDQNAPMTAPPSPQRRHSGQPLSAAPATLQLNSPTSPSRSARKFELTCTGEESPQHVQDSHHQHSPAVCRAKGRAQPAHACAPPATIGPKAVSFMVALCLCDHLIRPCMDQAASRLQMVLFLQE